MTWAYSRGLARLLGASGPSLKKPHRIVMQTTHSTAIETTAAVFGMLGAALLASAVHPGLGFAAFLVSNIGWLTVSAWQRQWPLHVQQWVFLACSLLGLWNWWLGPLVLG